MNEPQPTPSFGRVIHRPSSVWALCVGVLLGAGLGAASVSLVRESRPAPVAEHPALPGGPAPVGSFAVDDAARGERLWNALGCGDCHDTASGTGTNIPPALDFEGSRVRPEWLVAYLRHPTRIRYAEEDVRPLVRMPDFELDEGEARALAAYVLRHRDTKRVPPWGPKSSARPEEGRKVFEQYQCFGCHTIGGRGARVGPDLTHAGARLTASYMRALVLSPESVIPKTPMKNNSLWEEDADALVAYLDSLR